MRRCLTWKLQTLWPSSWTPMVSRRVRSSGAPIQWVSNILLHYLGLFIDLKSQTFSSCDIDWEKRTRGFLCWRSDWEDGQVEAEESGDHTQKTGCVHIWGELYCCPGGAFIIIMPSFILSWSKTLVHHTSCKKNLCTSRRENSNQYSKWWWLGYKQFPKFTSYWKE